VRLEGAARFDRREVRTYLNQLPTEKELAMEI